MSIQHIEIENYRGIQNLKMDFHEGINLLIGNNGAGKTSLLNAISVLIRTPLVWLQGVNVMAQIRNEEIYQTKAELSDATEQMVYHFPATIDGKVDLLGDEYNYSIKKENAGKESQISDHSICKAFQNQFGDGTQLFPLLCFQKVGRGTVINHFSDTVTISTTKPQRIQGYKNAFSSQLNLEEIQKWCLQMELAEFQKKKEIQEYRTFKDIISNFLSFVEQSKDKHKVYYSSTIGTLVYFDGKQEKPLHLKSDGFQAILCLIIELAYRTVLLNPLKEEIALTITGTVLIDEIEMHLHPAWQWKILDALRNTFPMVQFIISTHSPIILSSAKDSSLFLMKSPNEVIELDNTYGYSVNDVLLIPQNTDSVPPDIAKYYDNIEKILDEGTEEELNQLILKAKEEFSSSPTVLKSIMDFIEVNHWVEEA